MKTPSRFRWAAAAAFLALAAGAWGADSHLVEYSLTPGFAFNSSNGFVLANAGQPVVFAETGFRSGALTPEFDPRFACRATLIANGSFENPGVPDNYVALPGGSTVITAWTTTGLGVEYYKPLDSTADVSTGVAAEGTYALDLALTAPGSGIQQTFETVPGHLYHVLFQMGTARDKGRNGTATLVATVTGNPANLFGVATASAQVVWEQKHFSFTASGPSTTLAFATEEDPALSFVNLDEVRVTDCSLPYCVDVFSPPNVIAECTNAAGTIVNYTVTAANRCYPTNEVTVICDPVSGTAFPKGIWPVRCQAISQVGLILETNRGSFAVIVQDTQPPVLTCAPDKIVECGTPWNFDPATAWDACCTNALIDLGAITNVNQCLHVYEKKWRAVDCDGHAVECVQTVTEVDTMAPVSTCAPDKTIQLDPRGRILSIHSVVHGFFVGGDGANGGQWPHGGLVQIGDALYGTTREGGSAGLGTVFRLSLNDGGLVTLHNFSGGDGQHPVADLIQVGDGLYGTTGSSSFPGTIFKLNLDGGPLETLHVFSLIEGSSSAASLLQVGDALYGTTSYGGSSFAGTVFKWNPADGAFFKLHDFNRDDGDAHSASLIQVGDALYGTTSGQTSDGVSHGRGSVFKLNLSGGPLVTVHSFSEGEGNNPVAGLIQVGDALYGTTLHGGSGGWGTVFRLNLSGGPVVTLHSFRVSDGAFPQARLLHVGDALYGTTYLGGSAGNGTVFELKLSGGPAITRHHFTGRDGILPASALIQVGDSLYGTTVSGWDHGTIYKLSLQDTWAFDPPTALDACAGKNVDITELGTATNGTCPQVITRSWRISDCSGNSTNCSQTVTIYGNCVQVFAGLTNQLIGSSSAEIKSNRLVLFNSIDPGLAGLSIDLGAAEFGSVLFECLNPDALSTGASLTFRALGELNGTSQQLIAEFKAADIGPDIFYSWNPAALGPVPQLALLYDGNDLVATARIPTDTVYFARVAGEAGDAKSTPYLPIQGRPAMRLDFTQRPVVTLTGGQPHPATHIVVVADVTKWAFPEIDLDVTNAVTRTGLNFWWKSSEGPDPQISHAFIGPVSAVEVVAKEVPEVEILSEQLGLFGLAHESIGGAVLAGAGDSFLVGGGTNDPATEYGYDALAGGDGFWASESGVIKLVIPMLIPSGAYLRAGIIGPMFDPTHALRSGFEVRSIAPDTVTATPYSSSNRVRRVEVRRDGILVASTDVSNAVAATFSAWPNQFGLEHLSPVDVPLPTDLWLSYRWNANTLFNLSGVGPVAGNELRMRDLEDGPFPSAVKGIGLRLGGGLQEVQVIREKTAPIGLYFQGLAHRSMSNSALQLVGSVLVVSNAAQAASFGASVALGDASHGVVRLAGFSDADPEGATLRVRAVGTLNNVPDQNLGVVIAMKRGTNTEFSFDPIAIDLNKSLVSIYDGGRLVKVILGQSNLTVRVPSSPWLCNPIQSITSGSIASSIELPGRSSIFLPDDGEVTGDRLVLGTGGLPSPIPSSLGLVTRLEVLGSGLRSFAIVAEELGMFQRGHQVVGGVRLLAVGDVLRVDNFAVYPIDPCIVRFPLEHADTFSVWWRTLDRAFPVTDGSFIRIGGSGAFVGGQDQLLDSSQIKLIGGHKEISSECVALGALSRRVEVYRNAALVFATSLSGNTGVVAQVNDWPAGAGNRIIGPGGPTADVYWRWWQPAQFNISNQTVEGDELRILAENVPTLDHLSSFTLQAAGFPEVDLVADIAHAAAPITTRIQTVGGLPVISWDTTNPRQTLQQAEGVDGPWVDIPGTTPYVVPVTEQKKFLRVFQR